MVADIHAVRYLKSPVQPANALTDACHWGRFTRYMELGDDAFALRQVDEYENGHLTGYDRKHWTDQFGTLADFRYGRTWVKHWGEPNTIDRAEFEAKWNAAATSPPAAIRRASPVAPPPWIALYESGRWKGQP
jgi:hypothetical protein